MKETIVPDHDDSGIIQDALDRSAREYAERQEEWDRRKKNPRDRIFWLFLWYGNLVGSPKIQLAPGQFTIRRPIVIPSDVELTGSYSPAGDERLTIAPIPLIKPHHWWRDSRLNRLCFIHVRVPVWRLKRRLSCSGDE